MDRITSEPCWVRTSVSNPSGQSQQLEWKLWRYSSGQVMWEMRLVLGFMLGDLHESFWKIFRKTFGVFHDWIHLVLSESCIAPSRRWCRGEDIDVDFLVRDEFSCTTACLFGWLLWMAQNRKVKNERLWAASILKGLLTTMLDSDSVMTLLDFEVPASAHGVCDSSLNELCNCVRKVHAACPRGG